MAETVPCLGVKHYEVIQNRLNDVGCLVSDFRHYGHALHFTSIPGWEKQRGSSSVDLAVGLASDILFTLLLRK